MIPPEAENYARSMACLERTKLKGKLIRWVAGPLCYGAFVPILWGATAVSITMTAAGAFLLLVLIFDKHPEHLKELDT